MLAAGNGKEGGGGIGAARTYSEVGRSLPSEARTYSWVGVRATAGWSSGDTSEKENSVNKPILKDYGNVGGKKRRPYRLRITEGQRRSKKKKKRAF